MASTEPNAKNQHYVWQHYLNAWAAGGTFCCYRQKDKKLFPTQPKVVASETYFYETQQLTDADKTFLEHIISQATDEQLRRLNRDYVELIQRSFDLRAQLKSASLLPEVRADLEKKLRWVERNLGEIDHAGIESRCKDILDALRSQNDTFYQDEVRCGDFLYFLSMQYFRTAKMRGAQMQDFQACAGTRPAQDRTYREPHLCDQRCRRSLPGQKGLSNCISEKCHGHPVRRG